MVETGRRDTQTNTILNFPESPVQSLMYLRTTNLLLTPLSASLTPPWNKLELGPPRVKTNCGLVHVTANLLFHVLRSRVLQAC